MAVGQILCGRPFLQPDRSKRMPSFRIRLLSSIGFYPRGLIEGSKGVYYLDEQLAFIAVQTDEQRAHKYWSEVTFLAFEEIKFLAALLFSMRADHGLLNIYPGGAHIIDGPLKAGQPLHEIAKRLAAAVHDRHLTTTLPPARDTPYSLSGQTIDEKRYRAFVSNIFPPRSLDAP
jgi:hypothetical protein